MQFLKLGKNVNYWSSEYISHEKSYLAFSERDEMFQECLARFQVILTQTMTTPVNLLVQLIILAHQNPSREHIYKDNKLRYQRI